MSIETRLGVDTALEAFVWIGIIVAVISLRRGKWIPSIGAFVKGMGGTFPRWLGVFHPRLGTPVRGNLCSGAVATIFVIVATVLATFFAVLGTWVAPFPGILEKIFGLDYDFTGTWGVGRGRFEALTLGTVAVIVLLTLLGLTLGMRERRREAGELPAGGDINIGSA
jgi:hypothetical protein